MISFFCKTSRGKTEEQLTRYISYPDWEAMAPTTETLERGGRRAQGISQRFTSFLVITRQAKVLPPSETARPFFFCLTTLCVPSWSTKTALSLHELKVECISLEWRQIWLREGRGLLALGRYHFTSRGVRVNLQLYCTVWRRVRGDQGDIRSLGMANYGNKDRTPILHTF